MLPKQHGRMPQSVDTCDELVAVVCASTVCSVADTSRLACLVPPGSSRRRRDASPDFDCVPVPLPRELHPAHSPASRSRRRLSSRSVRLPGHLPQGLSKDRPSVDILHGILSHTPCSVLRRGAATHFARAALVVSHHLDGLLLHRLRRLVASCSRPWDSPCFHRSRATPHSASGWTSSTVPHPPELSPPE